MKDNPTPQVKVLSKSNIDDNLPSWLTQGDDKHSLDGM